MTTCCRWLMFFLLAVIMKPDASVIRVGDVIDIQVIQHPEFSGKFKVNENGTVDYPLLTDRSLVNIGTSELLQELTYSLARHIDNPLVTVSVIEKPEITVTVLGQVVKPGLITLVGGASVQEAIVSAGGPIPEKADLSRIKIAYADKSKPTETFNLESFLLSGEIERMPTLSVNDAVIVLSKEKTSSIKVIGAVQKPGLFSLEEKMNLFEVIYLAGGPSEKADLSRVRRLSKNINGKVIEEIIDIRNYIDSGRMENIPMVAEGDVVIIYSRWFDWKTMLTVLNNTLLIVVTIQAFAGAFK